MDVNSHVYMRLSEVYNIFCNVFEIKNVLIKTNNFVFCCVLIDHLVLPCVHQKWTIKKKTKSGYFSALQKIRWYLCIEINWILCVWYQIEVSSFIYKVIDWNVLSVVIWNGNWACFVYSKMEILRCVTICIKS